MICCFFVFFFFKQKTAYELRISDWSSDVCSSDLMLPAGRILSDEVHQGLEAGLGHKVDIFVDSLDALRFPEPIFGDMVAELVKAKYHGMRFDLIYALGPHAYHFVAERRAAAYLSAPVVRSEEHTSELQSLMRISFAGFCLKQKLN